MNCRLHDPAALLSEDSPPPPGTHRIGSVDDRPGLVDVGKTKISCPCQQSNPDSSVVQPVLSLHWASPSAFANLIIWWPSQRGIQIGRATWEASSSNWELGNHLSICLATEVPRGMSHRDSVRWGTGWVDMRLANGCDLHWRLRKDRESPSEADSRLSIQEILCL
jgi:hypothetical protein